MMKKILLAIVLATSLVACSQKYYPEMYQKVLWETLLKEVVLELEKRNKK